MIPDNTGYLLTIFKNRKKIMIFSTFPMCRREESASHPSPSPRGSAPSFVHNGSPQPHLPHPDLGEYEPPYGRTMKDVYKKYMEEDDKRRE